MKVSHIIIDSAPGIPTNILSIATASASGVRNKVVRGIMIVILWAFCSFWFLYLKIFARKFHDLTLEPNFVVDNLIFLTETPIPRLFLYSEADKVVPHSKIESYIQICKKKGIPVKEKKFNDSDHVQHYRAHKNEYENVIWEFIGTQHH